MQSNRTFRLGILCAVLVSIGLWGCDSGIPGSASGETIPEEQFVETIVELRRTALEAESREISSGERERILTARGVTEEDLRRFVEVHGGNVPRMGAVWTRIEARLTGQEPTELELDAEDFDTIPGLEPDPSGDPDEGLPGA